MTTRSSTPGYEALKTKAAILPDLDIALIELTGEDRLDWLQGQVTNDLRGLLPGDTKSFCLCEATGQIVAICNVWVLRDRLIITTDKAAMTSVLRRAETMVILEDVAARDLTGDYRLKCVRGPESRSILSDLFELPTAEAAVADGVLCFHMTGALAGWDLWYPNNYSVGLPSFAPTAQPEDYEVARLEAGIPKYGVDYTPKTLPPELGTAFEAKHVSYNKGCYMGQEVLMRIHSRGHTNKTWIGLILEGPVQPGDKVSHPSREDAGVVTSVAISSSLGPIAAATLRNEAAREGEKVAIGQVSGVVKSFPLC